MPELRELLERERDRLRMSPGSFEALQRRREWRRRARQLGSALLALALASAGVWGAVVAFGGGAPRPASPEPVTTSPAEAPTVPPPTPSPSASPAPPGALSQPASTLWVTEKHAWAVVSGELLVSTDGGASWSPVDLRGAEVRAVQFVDPLHGWAVSLDGLLRTVDGGVAWQPVGERTEVRTAQFVSVEEGWAVLGGPGGGGTLARTSDGGQSWEPVATPGPVDAVCAAPDGGAVWAARAEGGGVVLRLLRVGAGPVEQVPLRLPEGPWAGVEVRCEGDAAWVLATDGGAAGHQAFAILRVQGGTASPVLQEPGTHPFGPEGVPAAAGPYPGPLVALDGTRARFVPWCPPCDGPPAVMVTDDGGATWATVALPAAPGGGLEAPVGMFFVDADRGWLVLDRQGAEGHELRTLRTADGGATWAEG
jgi:photosystem II stability/assembly factor-like uncharacterized protein